MRKPKTLAFLLIAAAVAAHVAIFASALSPKGSRLFFDSDVISGTGCDFYAIWLAGDNLLRGHSVYFEPEPKTVPCLFSFRYLPAAAILGAPFALFSPPIAYLLWLGLIELSIAACLYLTWLLAKKRIEVFAPLACVWLCASPLYLEMRLGQYSLLQAAFITAAIWAAKSGSPKAFAAATAASLCFKLNTWLAAPSLVKARRYAPLLIAAAVLALTSLPHIILFPDSLQAFVQANFRMRDVSAASGFTRGNLSLAMLAGTIMGKSFSPVVVRAIFLLVFGFGLFATMRRTRMDLGDQLAFWLALSLLSYHQTWEHHYVMALPALTILGLRKRDAAFWLAAALILLPTPYALFRGDWQPWQEILYHAVKPSGLMILLASLAFGAKTSHAGSVK